MPYERITDTSKPGGRPKLGGGEDRSEILRFRTTIAERAQIESAARACGLSKSEYIRQLALGHKPRASAAQDHAATVSELNKLVLEAGRVGNNVNQLARSVHRDSAFQECWREIAQEVKSLNGKLTAALERVLRE